jgi:hypothetical protein
MKHLHILGVSVSVSLLLAGAASARETKADLMVKGAITPGGACTLGIANVLRLGTINREMLDPDPSKETELEEQRLPVTVVCPQPTRFAFVARGGGQRRLVTRNSISAANG